VFMDDESLLLNPQIDYHAVEGLSSEAKEKLTLIKPRNIVSAHACMNDHLSLMKCMCRERQREWRG
jgi:tRNA uridine 5-carboxymethylaminomethyl modification enzyme